MSKSRVLRTAEDVRREFSREGKTIAAWAREHGFPVKATSDVITGRNKGRYGRAHCIAVALGLKEGVADAQPAA